MNREIKFRGKRLDNGEWVYGDFVAGQFIVSGYYGSKRGYGVRGVYLGFDSVHVIDPETVGQYTGLKDTNDVEIYEGDIVRCKELTRKKLVEYTSVVFWDEYSFLVEDTNGCWSGLGLFTDDPTKYPLTEVDVIGNKWDNPELLEVLGDE